MATSDFLGLFVSPEQYQAQQLAQQQANEQQRAFNFAQLSPRDQAVYGTFLGAQQLGRGFSGLLGVQDPQLQRIRQREQIMQSINPADPESLMAGIQRASQSNDPELALTLANYMRDAASNVALTKQRETEKVPQDIQIAARIRQLTADRLKLPENERGPIDAEIKRLEKLGRQGSTDKVEQLRDLYVAEEDAVRKAQAKAAPSQTVGLDGLPMATQTPVNVDDDPEVRAIRSLIRVATGDKEGKEIEVVAKATALADTVSSDRNSAAWKEKYKTELTRLTADKDTEKPTEAERNAKIFAKNSGFPEGSEGFNKAFNTKFAELIGKGEKEKPTEAERNATIFAKNSGFAEGSPEFNNVFNTKFAELINKGRDKPNLTVVGEVRSGPNKGTTVYVDEVKDQQFIYSTNSKGEQVRKLISDADVSRMTSQISASASTSNIGERTVVKGVAELDVEDLKTVRANKRAASASNDSLRNLLALDDKGLISGAFATNRVGVGNLLNTLGILSKKDSNELANSQEYQKIGADLIFNALQGKLGAGVSNKDVDFIKEIFPQLETSATARRRLIKYLADKNNKQIDEADNFEAWIRKNKTAEGYKSLNSGVFHVPSTRLNLTDMSDAALDAAIKAKKAEKGK
jgi:hypothetical protein